MRRVVGELVDRVVGRGECELVADVCEPYPIPIICELLGAPPEDWKLFSAWATDIFRIFNNNLAEDLPLIERAGEELTAYVSDMIAARRADPRDDLLSDLIAIEQEGDRLSTDEMAMLAQAVLMAGTDTTRNQLACSVALFTEHPDQWALLAERPELAGRAVEESMRYLGAVRGTARFAAEDVVYRDVLFPQGTLVATSLAGANRDPEAFDDPDVFDITRERGTAQMTFGSGIHFCMGAALARAELQEALPLLARRLPGLARNGDIEWKPSIFGIWGPARLPLRFAPLDQLTAGRPGRPAQSRAGSPGCAAGPDVSEAGPCAPLGLQVEGALCRRGRVVPPVGARLHRRGQPAPGGVRAPPARRAGRRIRPGSRRAGGAGPPDGRPARRAAPPAPPTSPAVPGASARARRRARPPRRPRRPAPEGCGRRAEPDVAQRGGAGAGGLGRHGRGRVEVLPAVAGEPHLDPGMGVVGMDLVEVGDRVVAPGHVADRLAGGDPERAQHHGQRRRDLLAEADPVAEEELVDGVGAGRQRRDVRPSSGCGRRSSG